MRRLVLISSVWLSLAVGHSCLAGIVFTLSDTMSGLKIEGSGSLSGMGAPSPTLFSTDNFYVNLKDSFEVRDDSGSLNLNLYSGAVTTPGSGDPFAFGYKDTTGITGDGADNLASSGFSLAGTTLYLPSNYTLGTDFDYSWTVSGTTLQDIGWGGGGSKSLEFSTSIGGVNDTITFATAVPEPSAAFLSLFPALALIWSRRRPRADGSV